MLPEPHTLEQKMSELVETIAEKCFYGHLPPCPDILVNAMLTCVPALQCASPQELEPFVAQFIECVYLRLILEVETDLGVDLDPPLVN